MKVILDTATTEKMQRDQVKNQCIESPLMKKSSGQGGKLALVIQGATQFEPQPGQKQGFEEYASSSFQNAGPVLEVTDFYIITNDQFSFCRCLYIINADTFCRFE